MDKKIMLFQAHSGKQADGVFSVMQRSQAFNTVVQEGCHITATYYGNVTTEELLTDLRTYKGWPAARSV